MPKLWIYEHQNNPAGEAITMGNTHIESSTKEKLLEYVEEHKHKSPSRAIDTLLAEHDLLLATQGWLQETAREVKRLRILAEDETR